MPAGLLKLIYFPATCFLFTFVAFRITGTFSVETFFLAFIPFWLNFIIVNRMTNTIVLNMPKTVKSSFLDLEEEGLTIRLSIKNMPQYKGKTTTEILVLETQRLIQALDSPILDGHLDDHFDYGVYVDDKDNDKLIYRVMPKSEEAKDIMDTLKEFLR